MLVIPPLVVTHSSDVYSFCLTRYESAPDIHSTERKKPIRPGFESRSPGANCEFEHATYRYLTKVTAPFEEWVIYLRTISIFRLTRSYTEIKTRRTNFRKHKTLNLIEIGAGITNTCRTKNKRQKFPGAYSPTIENALKI